MSGASGKTPAAIHVTPEALDGGPLARIQDGDLVRLDAERGQLDVLVEVSELSGRPAATPSEMSDWGWGRELFAPFRAAVGGAERGATVFG